VRTAPFATPSCRGVLQERDVVVSHAHVVELLAAAFAQRPLHRTCPGMFHAGTIFLTCLTTRLVMNPLAPGNMSPICVVITVSPRARSTSPASREVLEDHDDRRAGVLDWCSSSRAVYSGLVLTTVSRRAARRTMRSVLQKVRQHDRDAIALLQSSDF